MVELEHNKATALEYTLESATISLNRTGVASQNNRSLPNMFSCAVLETLANAGWVISPNDTV